MFAPFILASIVIAFASPPAGAVPDTTPAYTFVPGPTKTLLTLETPRLELGRLSLPARVREPKHSLDILVSDEPPPSPLPDAKEGPVKRNGPVTQHQGALTEKWWFWASLATTAVLATVLVLVLIQPEQVPRTSLGNMRVF